MLDPSALAGLYLRKLSRRQAHVYWSVTQGRPAAWKVWKDLIGVRNTQAWLERCLLEEISGNRLYSKFRVIALEDIILVTDLEISFENRVHIGQDSLNIFEYLRARKLPRNGRYLDIGTGSGVLLLLFGQAGREATGIDVNPRAIRVAGLNVELNRNARCSVYEQDIFAMGEQRGRFDLVTWNVPFMFLPPEFAKVSVDGYGGQFGIELTVKCADDLPKFLTDTGKAYLLSAAPILANGRNVLEESLASLPARRRLDFALHSMQCFWVPALREFHERHGIKRFESVLIEIGRGSGRIRKMGPAFSRRVLDEGRSALYEGMRSLGQGLRPKGQATP